MKPDQINIADNFFGMIKNLSQDVRLDLIDRISESLTKEKKSDKSNNEWRSLFGSFESSKSADEIIEEIRESRNTNRNVEEF